MSNRVSSVDPAKLPTQKASAVSSQSANIPFADIFNQALEIQDTKPKGIEYNLNQKIPLTFEEESELLAQALNPNEIDEIYRDLRRRKRNDPKQNAEKGAYLGTERYEITPFQLFIDKAVEVLESISEQDFRVNDLTEKYVRGEASIDEVSIEMTKLNLAVSFATTILSSATGAFKEISGIAL